MDAAQKRLVELSRTMPLSSKDPCGGLDATNFDAIKKSLMAQQLRHHEYKPQFHQKRLQKIFKVVMKVPDELLTSTAKHQSIKPIAAVGRRANDQRSVGDKLKMVSQENSLSLIKNRFEKNFKRTTDGLQLGTRQR